MFVARQLCPNIDMQANFMLILIVFIILVVFAVIGGIALGVKTAPTTPDYGEQNMDTQKATTTNQASDSVAEDPKAMQDTEKGDIELKKKDETAEPETGRGVETDRPMVDETKDENAV